MALENFDIPAFLRNDWQRQPRLFRGVFPEWTNPLEPDELAGLACEEGVESRLIFQHGDKLRMENGPLAEDRFEKLGAQPWTLLVQAVDQHVPDVADLIEPFRFIPDWRIDDVMVSYASDGGGVGPHFDQYDVFLVQGLGRRRWTVGPRCDASTPLRPHEDLRLLEGFEPTGTFVLEPGDMLYVPPGFAHDGVAVGDDCMTYSIGFRAPSRHDLIEGWSEELLSRENDDDRYADPGLPAQDHPGEIVASALDGLHKMVTESLQDREAFARWFGCHNTTPKYADQDWHPEEPLTEEEVREGLEEGLALYRNPASRFAFVARGGDALWLFADGTCFEASGATAALAKQICAGGGIEPDAALADLPAAITLIVALCNQGSLAFEDED
jgi:50S ribosomal protein L16 3-hydroxylase